VSSEPVLHRETQVFPFRTAIVIVEFLCFALIPEFLSLPLWTAVSTVAAGLLAALLTYSVLILRVEITASALEFGFWFSSPKIPLTKIRNPEIVKIPKLAGIGTHFYRWYRVYNARFGRGVQFSLQNNKKYMIGSDHPERLLSMLKSVMPRENG
jgi:hypothetical protein